VTRASAVFVLLLAGPAAAQPAKLSMRVTDGTNLHIANQGGAIHWSADITLTVELRANKTVEAAATGWRKEHNLYAGGSGPSYNTDEETRLAIKWNGTWLERNRKLQIDLVLVSDKCTRMKTSDGVQPETLACRPASSQTVLTCTTQSIELEGAPPNAKRKVDAWSCQPKASDDLGESPPWLLGKTTCIGTSGSHMGGSQFQNC
jgi:hypothetical protein